MSKHHLTTFMFIWTPEPIMAETNGHEILFTQGERFFGGMGKSTFTAVI